MKKLIVIIYVIGMILFGYQVATASPLTQCQGITKKGTQCTRQAGKNGYCYQHNPSAHKCEGTTKAGQPCQIVTKAGTHFCRMHSK